MMVPNGNVGRNRRESTAAAVGKRSKDVSSAVRKLDREPLPTLVLETLIQTTADESLNKELGVVLTQ
jgi:hypothetical protein